MSRINGQLYAGYHSFIVRASIINMHSSAPLIEGVRVTMKHTLFCDIVAIINCAEIRKHLQILAYSQSAAYPMSTKWPTLL
jgi:hypothetical protein